MSFYKDRTPRSNVVGFVLVGSCILLLLHSPLQPLQGEGQVVVKEQGTKI